MGCLCLELRIMSPSKVHSGNRTNMDKMGDSAAFKIVRRTDGIGTRRRPFFTHGMAVITPKPSLV